METNDTTDFTFAPDAQLIAEFEAIEQTHTAERIAEGATPKRAAAEWGQFCVEVAQAFDQAPLIGAALA